MYLFLLILTNAIILSIFINTTPIALGLWIIIITLSITFFISIFSSSWLALLIFLIYIGGILVIFAYFSALIPNQQIKIFYTIIYTIINIIIIYPIFFFSNINNLKFINLQQIRLFNSPYFLNSISFLILIILILLLIIIIVVKICIKSNIPIRPFIYV